MENKFLTTIFNNLEIALDNGDFERKAIGNTDCEIIKFEFVEVNSDMEPHYGECEISFTFTTEKDNQSTAKMIWKNMYEIKTSYN